MVEVKKWPLWSALVHAKCPRCRRGDMFCNKMYGLHGQFMNKQCSHCKLTYEIEPGYFYVAMFVSYAMMVAQMITVAIVVNLITGSENPWVYLIVILSVTLTLSPFNFRYSRVILLYWLTPGIRYEAEMSLDNNDNAYLISQIQKN